MTCEKCWQDAYSQEGDQTEKYHELLLKRRDKPCSPKEQAGQWWDEEKQCDSRFIAIVGEVEI